MLKKMCFITPLLLMVSITSARAVAVTENVLFDLSATAQGLSRGRGVAVQELNQLKPFDSSLGQLDQVKVGFLTGNLFIHGTSGRNDFPLVGTLPYTILSTIKIGIGGATDFFDITSIDSLHNSAALGVGHPITPTLSQFGFNFTIDETTEKSFGRPLGGLNTGGIPKSIPLVSGKRSDFLDNEIISDLLLFSLKVDFTSTSLAPIRTASIVKARLWGLMQVKYDYTPGIDPVSPIPIPAAIYLFGTALIGLVGFRKLMKAA
jgi:hypothetical protein